MAEKGFSAEETLAAMKMQGVTLPKHPQRQLETAERVSQNLASLNSKQFAHGFTKSAGAGSSTSLVMPKYFDPRMSDTAGYPGRFLDMENKVTRDTVQDYCRLFYTTHPIIGSLIDIYARYPVDGAEMVCKDTALTKFYTELFLEDLDYENFLIDLGREKWTVGEAYPFAAWDEELGIWAAEELLNPSDMEVKRMPLTGKNTFLLNPPQFMKDLVLNRTPYDMFVEFKNGFPDLVKYIERNMALLFFFVGSSH